MRLQKVVAIPAQNPFVVRCVVQIHTRERDHIYIWMHLNPCRDEPPYEHPEKKYSTGDGKRNFKESFKFLEYLNSTRPVLQ
jgi:hypothetical protein